MQLQSLDGWLRFPGPLPVARIRLNYIQRPKAAERFVPRGGAVAPDTAAAAAGQSVPSEGPGAERSKAASKARRKAQVPRSDLLDLPPFDPDDQSSTADARPSGETLPLPLADMSKEPERSRKSTPKSGADAKKRGKRESEAQRKEKRRNGSGEDGDRGGNRRADAGEQTADSEVSPQPSCPSVGVPNDATAGPDTARDTEESGRTAGPSSADWL